MANSTNQKNSVQAKIDAYVKQKQQKQKKKDKKWYEEFINVERIKNVDSFGDALKVTGQTMLDTAGNAWQGVFQGAEGLADFVENRYADVADKYANAGTAYYNFLGQYTDQKNIKFIKSAADTLRKSASDARAEAAINQTQAAANDFEHILAGDLGYKKSDEDINVYENIHQDSALGDSGRGMVQSMALNATTAALNSASGGTLGIPLIAVSAAGNAEQEALNNGATAEEALTYGIISGSIEAGTELLFGGLGKISEGLGFGKGAVDDQLIKQLNKKIKSTAIKNLASYTIKAGGEGLEEVLAGVGNAYAKKLTYMSEEDIKKLIEDEDLLNSFIMGTLSSAVMQAPSTITSTAQGRDVNTGLTQVQQEYVNEIAEQRLAAAQKRNEKLNRYQQMKIEDRTLQDFQENRLFDKSKLPMSDNVKDMDLQQSAVKYNIDPNAEAVVNVKAMLDKRGVKSRFDADAFKNVNGNAFWSNKNGVREVVFNPNASMDTIVEEVAIHELTHDLMSSTNSQSEINKQKIIDYVSTLDGYNEIRQNVENKYKNQTKGMSKAKAEAYINEEIIADTLGKNIGSQEYIRQLVDSQPSLSKVIYNWIVKTVNNLANKNGVKKERLYWENIKNNFEKAYNMDWEGKGKKTDSKYSIGGIKGINNVDLIKNKEFTKYVENAKNSYSDALNMAKEGYTNEQIRNETKWYQDRNGDWKFEFSDKDFNFKVNPQNIEIDKMYKLGDLIEHKFLNVLYPEIMNYDVIFKTKKAQGSFSPTDKVISINKEKLTKSNAKASIEGTLIHEIQHAIQQLENFETGRSSKLSRKRYYESLGEAEATDTRTRMELERKGRLNREITPPLSFYEDAKHPNYDYYMENRGVIDKIKDSLYSFITRGEINEVSQEVAEENQDKNNRLVDGRGRIELDNSSFFDADIRYSLSEADDVDFKNIQNGTEEQIRKDLLAVRDWAHDSVMNEKRAEINKLKPNFFSKNTDDYGRKLSKGQKEYFKDTKARGINDSLVTVYHTMTNEGAQFYEFNPVVDDHYRFGEQTVNYFTNSKDMSGSYANQEYKMADTKTFKTIDDVNQWLAEKSAVTDKHYIKEVDGKYYLYNNNLPTRHSWDNMQTMFDEVKDKFYENPFYSVDNKPRKFQYEGYVNITNPYIVDAEGQMWDSVKSGIDPKIAEQLNRITAEEKKALTQLAKNSVEMHETQWTKEIEDEYYAYENKFKDLTLDEEHQVIYHQLGMELENPNKEIHVEGWVGSRYIDRYETLESFANKYNELSEYRDLYRDETSYFQRNFKNILNTNKIENIRNTDLFDIAYQDFKEENYAGVFQKDFSTNDVVFEVLKKNQNGANYDGVILKNVIDYGGDSVMREPNDLYITFNSNQFKAVDNTSPTDDADIRYSLSDTQEERIAKLQEEYSLLDKTRDVTFDERDALRKQLNDLIRGEEYKNAETKFKEMIKSGLSPDEISKTPEYQLMAEEEQIRKKLREYDEDVKVITEDMTRISEMIENEEKSHRNPKDAIKQAKEFFGTTNDFREAGYLLQDGTLLDFSGRTQGSNTYGRRTLDHREINEVGYDMDEFIELGNIRMKPEASGFELSKPLTQEQKSMLRDYLETLDDDIMVDITKDGHVLYDSATFKKGTSASKIFNDINYYFENGKFPEQSKYAEFRYSLSKENSDWQSFLDKNFKPKGTKTKLGDIKLPGLQNAIQEEVQNQAQQALLPIANELKELNKNLNKVMNPSEIAQLTLQDANTTPKLPGVTRNKESDGKSKFFDNVNNKVGMLNDEQKAAILNDEDVKYYDKVTNKDSLDKAFERLQENGANESLRWFNNKSENATATDVAEGWILLKQYADSGNTEGMVEVAKKMREIGTKAGQTVQAFNILSRLTPEGMVKYAQSELMEAYDIMVKNKSAKWIEENRSKFELKPEEVQFIMDTMKDVSTMEDGYDKKFKLAQIQKIMTDKLPPEKGAGMKAWMRISMLFNPKTQVRNVAGNAIIAPVNAFGDLFASAADKLISSKTGVRTTGNINLKNYAKGMGTGLYQSYNDFKHGVNTRNIEGNRFEISQGKSFKDTNPIGKALNKVDRLLSFMLDAGDRGFYEAAFTNSINNQLVLNNTTEVTQEMIDIATQEALSRTWQDNNKYTKFVMSIRNQLNQINVAGYGLGDVLIPFAKTPANLTKAIVDYSPAGLIGTINKGIQLKKSLTNGQYSAQMQHDFVQSLGKAVAGTMLYVAGIALANAGVTTGESDEDKDTANFLKNTLGINSYSIKIGDRTFTYDWAQPIAAPLAITANLVQKQKEEATLLENITSTLDTAGNLLLEQSFMESISTVLNNNEGIATGIQEAILDLPARAVPTLFKQIVDITDGTQRQTFEKGKPLQSAVNSVKAKIPGLSQTLSPSVDTLGRDIEKYGGKNNIFNVFINPANVNTENVSESAAEIYKVYKATGETSVMPRVAPYTITIDNKKINLSAKDRTEYQRISGEIIENNVQNLISTIEYNNLPDKEKAEVIKNIVNYSYNIAQKEMYGKDLSDTYENAYEYSQIGDVSDYYTFKASIDDTNAQTKKTSIKEYLVNSYLNDEQIAKLYGAYYSSESELSLMLNAKVPMKEYVKFNSEEFVSDYNNKGNAITNSRRNKMINYINGLNLNQAQKVILIKTEYSSFNNYDNVVFNYINKLPDSAYNKMVMLKKVGFDDYDNQIIAQVNAQNISREEKIKKLKEMGFTIRNGRVYS